MLADDPLGARRESDTSPLPRCYHDAFDAIDRDPNIELVVAQAGAGGALGALGIVGVLQLSFIPNLSHRGGWRALIEGVRVAAAHRCGGVGRQMLQWAIERARQRAASWCSSRRTSRAPTPSVSMKAWASWPRTKA